MVYPHVMLKRYIHTTIIFAILAIPIAILNYNLFESFADSPLIIICEWLVAAEELAEMGFTVADVASDLFIFFALFILDPVVIELGYTVVDVAYKMFIMIALLNVWLLALTYVYIIILDTINISLHWLIKSGIFVGLIIVINFYFLNSTAYPAGQFFSASGVVVLTVCTTIYYLVMFLIILIVKNWLSKKHA